MAITIKSNGITEAQASAVYFLETSTFNTGGGYAVVVDIGGGTTDISFWNNRKLKWEDSVKFAGGDVIDILIDLKKFVEINTVFNSYDLAMRDWPYVEKKWNTKMEDLRSKEFCNKTFRTLGLFYGGLCYYIGMHMKSNNLNVPIKNIAFAGNGIRFLEIITFGNSLIETEPSLNIWIKLFKRMLSAGHGSINYDNSSFVFSQNPKLEIAHGLVSPILEEYITDGETSKKILGLNIKLDGNQHDFNEWPKSYKARDYGRAEVDFGYLLNFVNEFKLIAQDLFQGWNLDLLPNEFNSAMDNSFRSSLEYRGQQELASSLFLESLVSYMKWQYQI